MKSVALNAFPRSLGRRPGAKRLRAAGRIPAIIYGRQAQPQKLEVIAKEMDLSTLLTVLRYVLMLVVLLKHQM